MVFWSRGNRQVVAVHWVDGVIVHLPLHTIKFARRETFRTRHVSVWRVALVGSWYVALLRRSRDLET